MTSSKAFLHGLYTRVTNFEEKQTKYRAFYSPQENYNANSHIMNRGRQNALFAAFSEIAETISEKGEEEEEDRTSIF